MKKKSVFSAISVLFILVLFVALVWGYYSSMVKGRPTLNVWVEDVSLKDGCFSMTARQDGNSWKSFRHSSYEIEDDKLYVILYSGLAYGNYRSDCMDVSIRKEELRAVRQVYLRDSSASKLIYFQ